MSIIWCILLLGGFLFAILGGHAKEAASSAISAATAAVQLCLSFAGLYALWLGILKIAEKAGLVKVISKRLKWLIKKLFPEVEPDSPASGYITLNIAANILGLGNAATPFGLKAIKELQENNRFKKRATNAMCILLVLNSSSVQIIPTTIISLRSSTGSANPYVIIFPALIATAFAAICGIIAVKILERKS